MALILVGHTFEEFLMARKRPPSRIVTLRSRNNPHRRLIAVLPSMPERLALSAQVNYGAYAKHKFHPTAYKLAPYAGQDVERTYCDAHAGFGREQSTKIPVLLKRGVMLGLWSDQREGGIPSLLWTIDESGWIFELRVTNAGQLQYHGYPVLPADAFARHVLVRAREMLSSDGHLEAARHSGASDAIAAAETFYR